MFSITVPANVNSGKNGDKKWRVHMIASVASRATVCCSARTIVTSGTEQWTWRRWQPQIDDSDGKRKTTSCHLQTACKTYWIFIQNLNAISRNSIDAGLFHCTSSKLAEWDDFQNLLHTPLRLPMGVYKCTCLPEPETPPWPTYGPHTLPSYDSTCRERAAYNIQTTHFLVSSPRQGPS